MMKTLISSSHQFLGSPLPSLPRLRSTLHTRGYPAKICWKSIRIQLETSRLYRQAWINPLAGCFPTLATIPVWIGLYQSLSNVANEGLLIEGFFWIPSLGGPTTIAARQSGSGISWLLPFVDGHPPLGWHDTVAYLVLPVLLVASQYISMEIMKPPPTDDPAQKNTLLVFKLLLLMICYFSLSGPSGLSLYWFTNNVLSTGQQVWLHKLGGANPVIDENAGGIITAGLAKRSAAQPEQQGERFKQLKEEERNKKQSKALLTTDIEAATSDPDSEEEDSEEETKDKGKEVSEETVCFQCQADKQSEKKKKIEAEACCMIRMQADKLHLLGEVLLLAKCSHLYF